MPVDVGVALVGVRRHDVHSLGPDFTAHRLCHPVDNPLEDQILLDREIRRRLLPALLRRNERVAALGRPPAEEGDGVLVLVDDVVVGGVWISRHDPADETRPAPRPLVVGVQVGSVSLERSHTPYHPHKRRPIQAPAHRPPAPRKSVGAGSKPARHAEPRRHRLEYVPKNSASSSESLCRTTPTASFYGPYPAASLLAELYPDAAVVQEAGRKGQVDGGPDHVRVLEPCSQTLSPVVVEPCQTARSSAWMSSVHRPEAQCLKSEN